MLAIIAIKDMEAADPGPMLGAQARRPRDPEAGAAAGGSDAVEGAGLSEGEGSSSSDSSDSDSEEEEKAEEGAKVGAAGAKADPAGETWEDWCAPCHLAVALPVLAS